MAKSQIFTKTSLKEIQDKMRKFCIEKFNEIYEQNATLKQKQKGRNRDINVNQMDGYSELKREQEKNTKIKEHKKAEYSIMLMDGTLNSHLKEFQETAIEIVEQIIKQLKAKSNLTEDMKNTDMFYWVGMMNNFKNQAEEIIFNELIYV